MKPREWRVMRAVADALMAWNVSPNAISIFGVIACSLAGAAMAATSRFDPSGAAARLLWIAGAVGVQLRGLCNLFDGMVAVGRGVASPVGELYNEVPDRISDAAMLIGLGYAAGSSPMLGFSAAIVAVFVAYVRAQCRVAGAPQDYRGPMAKPQRIFLVTGVCVYHALTPALWHGHAVAAGLVVVIVGGIITAGRRLAAAAHRLRGGQGV